MNERQLRALVTRYLDAETTLDEERVLREYFLSGQRVPNDLIWARGMFGCFADGQRQEMPRTDCHPHRRSSFRPWMWSGAAAAVAAVGVLFLTLTPGRESRPAVVYCYVNGQPVTDYEEALEQTRMVLSLLSSNLDVSERGLNRVWTLSEPLLRESGFMEKYGTQKYTRPVSVTGDTSIL